MQAVTGASAGAITGALGAIALARGFRPRMVTLMRSYEMDRATNGLAFFRIGKVLHLIL